MTQHREKSRTFRRIKKKVPGNSTVTHYVKKSHKKAHCGKCGAALHTSNHRTPCDMKKLTKSQKRPERPYGGVLCPKCSREEIKAKARK